MPPDQKDKHQRRLARRDPPPLPIKLSPELKQLFVELYEAVKEDKDFDRELAADIRDIVNGKIISLSYLMVDMIHLGWADKDWQTTNKRASDVLGMITYQLIQNVDCVSLDPAKTRQR